MPQRQSVFGNFHFDPVTLQLRSGRSQVAISGLPLRILEILLESGGRVVTRLEFKETFWPHAVRIDTERRLNTAVRALREALGDSGGKPRYIETIRGRGYRWLGGQRVSASTRGAWRLALSLASATLAIGGSTANLAAAPSPAEQAKLVALTGAPDRVTAIARLDQLVRQRPQFADAQRLRAQLSVEEWRSSPDLSHLESARRAVGDAAAALGPSGPLEALDAELELAGRWHWQSAEQRYRSALRHDPDNISARRGLAWLFVNSGRRDEAWEQISHMISLSNMNGEAQADLGWLMLRMDRPDLAESVCRNGDAPINLLACRHTAQERLGSIGPARDTAIVFMQAARADESAIAEIRHGPPRPAYRRFLIWRAANFLPATGHWFQRAQLQAAAGRNSAALDALEQALAAHDPSLVKLASTAEFRPLHRSPRYRALLAAVTARLG